MGMEEQHEQGWGQGVVWAQSCGCPETRQKPQGVQDLLCSEPEVRQEQAVSRGWAR